MSAVGLLPRGVSPLQTQYPKVPLGGKPEHASAVLWTAPSSVTVTSGFRQSGARCQRAGRDVLVSSRRYHLVDDALGGAVTPHQGFRFGRKW
jgi:hypothetical protein